MLDQSAIEAIEWHDGKLDKVEVSSSGTIVKFAKTYVYRRRERDVYDVEECEGQLAFAGVSELTFTGSIDEESWVSDCTLETASGEARVQELLTGTSSGRWELVLTNGARIEGRFARVKLELSGPYRFVETWTGPLVAESDG